jgi:hypothetical protein
MIGAGKGLRPSAAAWVLVGLATASAPAFAAGISGEALRLAQAQPPATAQPPNVEASIAQLHQRLQITAAQEPQFAAVAGVMRDNARAAAAVPPPAANATAIDDLRAYIRFSEQELAGLKRLLPALDALYATLSPAQRQTADTVLRQGPGG